MPNAWRRNSSATKCVSRNETHFQSFPLQGVCDSEDVPDRFRMSEPIVTYLNDHLGGAQIAIQLLSAMGNQHEDKQFREFATNQQKRNSYL